MYLPEFVEIFHLFDERAVPNLINKLSEISDYVLHAICRVHSIITDIRIEFNFWLVYPAIEWEE